MSVFEENLREEIRKLERKYEDQKNMNEKLVSSKCSGSCKKTDVEYLKAMLLVCVDLLEKSQPREVETTSEWLSRRVAVKAAVTSL